MAEEMDRREADPWRDEVRGQIKDLNTRLEENTALTHAIKANTDEIVEVFGTLKGFVRMGGALGTGAKWLAQIATASAIMWVVFKYGVAEAIRAAWGGK